jgi:hypothetical protein
MKQLLLPDFNLETDIISSHLYPSCFCQSDTYARLDFADMETSVKIYGFCAFAAIYLAKNLLALMGVLAPGSTLS